MEMTVKIQMESFEMKAWGIMRDLVLYLENKYSPEKTSIIKRYDSDQPVWAVSVSVEGDDKLAGIIQQDAEEILKFLVGDTQGAGTTKNGIPETAIPL